MKTTNEEAAREASAPDLVLDDQTEKLQACGRCGTGNSARELVFVDGFGGHAGHVCCGRVFWDGSDAPEEVFSCAA